MDEITLQPDSSLTPEEREVGILTVIDIQQEHLYCCFQEVVPVHQYLSESPEITAAAAEVPFEVVRGLEEVLSEYLKTAPRLKYPEYHGSGLIIKKEEDQEFKMKDEMDEKAIGEEWCSGCPEELADFDSLPPPHLLAPWGSLKVEDEPMRVKDEGTEITEALGHQQSVGHGGIISSQTEDDEECPEHVITCEYGQKDIHKIIFGEEW